MIVIFIVVVTIIAASKIGPAIWVLSAAVVIVWYWHDVRRNPRVSCRVCKGSGDNISRLVGGAGWLRKPFGDCFCCGGRKAHPRLAARVLAPARYRDAKQEIRQARGRITR